MPSEPSPTNPPMKTVDELLAEMVKEMEVLSKRLTNVGKGMKANAQTIQEIKNQLEQEKRREPYSQLTVQIPDVLPDNTPASSPGPCIDRQVRRAPWYTPPALGQKVQPPTRAHSSNLHAIPQPIVPPIQGYIPYVRDEELIARLGIATTIDPSVDISQDPIIKKINLYLSAVNAEIKKRFPHEDDYQRAKRKLFPTKGICHGLGPYKAFFLAKKRFIEYTEPRNLILNCPPEHLLDLGRVFEGFIANIQRGHEPKKFLDAKLSQHDVDKIMGTDRICAPTAKKYTDEQLTKELEGLLQPNRIINFIGTNTREIVKKDGKKEQEQIHHSITVNCEDDSNRFIDSNDREFDYVDIYTLAWMRNRLWDSFTTRLGAQPQKELTIRIDVVKRPPQSPRLFRNPPAPPVVASGAAAHKLVV